MVFATDITRAVGGTPMVLLNRVCAGFPARVVAKLESSNPGGSVKDRIGARHIHTSCLERYSRLTLADAARSGAKRPCPTDV